MNVNDLFETEIEGDYSSVVEEFSTALEGLEQALKVSSTESLNSANKAFNMASEDSTLRAVISELRRAESLYSASYNTCVAINIIVGRLADLLDTGDDMAKQEYIEHALEEIGVQPALVLIQRTKLTMQNVYGLFPTGVPINSMMRFSDVTPPDSTHA